MTPAHILKLYLKWIRLGQKMSDSSNEAIAGWSLLYKPSFRVSDIPEKLAVFRQYRRLTHRLNQNDQSPVRLIDGGAAFVAAFDNRIVTCQLRIDHVEQNTGKSPAVFISREALLSTAYKGKSKYVGLLKLFFLSLFSMQRSNLSLLLIEIHEAAALLAIIKQYQIKELHFFSSYEKDSNALTLLLQKAGVNVNKIPSPSLLSVHHNQLIADSISLGSPYQEDELALNTNTIRYSKINHWTPELWPTYGKKYENIVLNTPKSIIGFYSHAAWLRSAEGNTDRFGDHAAEHAAIVALSEYLKTRQSIKLLIFLHPREKKNDMLSKTQEHYNGILESIPYQFSESSPSAQQFEKVDVGFGGISTILFERQFAGFKTIFYPKGVKNFPLPDSNLANICPTESFQLEKLLDEAIELSATDFFKKYGLEKYTRASWIKS